MDILKNQIRKLSEITVVDNAYENVEEKLQLLGKTLITDYIIKIGGIYSGIKYKFTCILYKALWCR